MNILLFGVSNVGKSTTGKLLASRLKCHFYDLSIPSNKIIAVSPLSYIHPIRNVFSAKNVFTIELIDSAENIFDRLVFSDEKDNI